MASDVAIFEELEAVSEDAGGRLDRGIQPSLFDRLFLEPAVGDDRLAAALRRRGWAVVRGQVNASWRINTLGMSFEHYWASRPARRAVAAAYLITPR